MCGSILSLHIHTYVPCVFLRVVYIYIWFYVRTFMSTRRFRIPSINHPSHYGVNNTRTHSFGGKDIITLGLGEGRASGTQQPLRNLRQQGVNRTHVQWGNDKAVNVSNDNGCENNNNGGGMKVYVSGDSEDAAGTDDGEGAAGRGVKRAGKRGNKYYRKPGFGKHSEGSTHKKNNKNTKFTKNGSNRNSTQSNRASESVAVNPGLDSGDGGPGDQSKDEDYSHANDGDDYESGAHSGGKIEMSEHAYDNLPPSHSTDHSSAPADNETKHQQQQRHSSHNHRGMHAYQQYHRPRAQDSLGYLTRKSNARMGYALKMFEGTSVCKFAYKYYINCMYTRTCLQGPDCDDSYLRCHRLHYSPSSHNVCFTTFLAPLNRSPRLQSLETRRTRPLQQSDECVEQAGGEYVQNHFF